MECQTRNCTWGVIKAFLTAEFISCSTRLLCKADAEISYFSFSSHFRKKKYFPCIFLVFQVFSTAELISLAKTVNLAVWAFSLIFLHDFTLFGIDMHNIYHISSISTTFGPLWNMGFPGLDPNLHLALCLKRKIFRREKIPFQMHFSTFLRYQGKSVIFLPFVQEQNYHWCF